MFFKKFLFILCLLMIRCILILINSISFNIIFLNNYYNKGYYIVCIDNVVFLNLIIIK